MNFKDNAAAKLLSISLDYPFHYHFYFINAYNLNRYYIIKTGEPKAQYASRVVGIGLVLLGWLTSFNTFPQESFAIYFI